MPANRSEKSGTADLQAAYDDYMGAEFGNLIATADALTAAAKRVGYEFAAGVPGVLPWVREKLNTSSAAVD